VVFVGRFVPVLRLWAAVLAGTHRMSWTRFLVCNAAGGALWATVMGWGAYALGSSALRLGGPIGLTMAALGTLAMATVLLALKRHECRWQGEANRTPAVRHARAA
jgi:membrane protein DedA with SNARE-associated domain